VKARSSAGAGAILVSRLWTAEHSGEQRKERRVDQQYAITVKFLVNADSAEDAEEMVETACEKAAAAFPDMSYEGIEDIEEEEEE
jgi:hypothetical protein